MRTAQGRSIALVVMCFFLVGCEAEPGPSSPIVPADVVCEPSPRDDFAQCNSLKGDLDADGLMDQIVISGSAGEGRVRVSFENGETTDTALTLGMGRSILGLVDADGDRTLEAFVMTTLGANTGAVVLLKLIEGRLTKLRTDEDEPFVFAYGAAVAHSNGFRCRSDGRFEVVGARLKEGDEWEFEKHIFEFDGAIAREVDVESGTVEIDDEGRLPPDVAVGARCGSLHRIYL